MEGFPAPPGSSVALCVRPSASVVAGVLVDEAEGLRLTVDIDSATGSLVVTLSGDGVEALGRGQVSLERLSPHTAMIATTVILEGLHSYDSNWLHVEASVSLAWTVDRLDPELVELAGTALLTDLDHHRLVGLRAVRFHAYNRFRIAADPVVPTRPAMIRPISRAVGGHRSSRGPRASLRGRYVDDPGTANRSAP